MFNENNGEQEMTVYDVPLLPGTRVVCFDAERDKMVRAHVVGGIDGITVDVTLKQGGDVITYNRKHVFPLYIVAKGPDESPHVVPLFYLKNGPDIP